MNCLDLSFPTPAENLACDEALLDASEEGTGDEILRFWETQMHFVVVGYSNRVRAEVDTRACEAAKIPILRRCTGGGTVLQGPGCLNYALILKIHEAGPLRSIAAANRFIMERNRAALTGLMQPRPAGASSIEVQGHTDLAVSGWKVSGNSQRRRKRFLLFHGTFLFQLDFSLMERILPMPSQEPAYRRHRAHRDFLTHLTVPPMAVKRALQEVWGAFSAVERVPLETISLLARDKYETTAWNLKFL